MPGMTMPTESVNIYDAKSRLSQLVARAERGERIVISRYGRPVAQLVPFAQVRAERRPGAWAGLVSIADDFDDLSAADEAEWYGA